MAELFTLPDTIPGSLGEAVLYRTASGGTRRSNFNKRLNELKEIFKLRIKPKDFGESVVFSEKTFELELFRASDSIWWEHNRLAYRELVPENSKLPEKNVAITQSEKYIQKFNVDAKHSKYSHISYSKLIKFNKKSQKKEKWNTEINVNYLFKLNGFPVEGPGAKMQASFVERKKLCEFYFFWRDPKKDTKLPILNPDKALEIFCKDAAFRQLSASNASVKIHAIEFVYYALPPLEIQNYYLPAYKIDGTVTTQYHEHHFANYLFAIDLSTEEMKEKGLLTENNVSRII